MRLAALALLALFTACNAPTSGLSNGQASRDAAIAALDAGAPGALDAGGAPACEGCPCNSSLRLRDINEPFRQDDCEAGLICVPWDLESNRALSGPMQSCVQPCAHDSPCPSGQCQRTDFAPQRLLGGVCVEERAPLDRYCGFHGLSTEVDQVPMRVAGKRVGCASGSCARDVFPEIHAGEGVCLLSCDANRDCPLEAPFCNTVPGSPRGICSVDQLGPGASCTLLNSVFNPGVAGYSNQCDGTAGDDLVCTSGQGLYPLGTGFCVASCSDEKPCTRVDPDLGPYQCRRLENSTEGSCTLECSNFPENCGDAGRAGQGFACFAGDRLGSGFPRLGFCLERLLPALGVSVLSADGLSLLVDGGDCDSDEPAPHVLNCPEPTFCAFGSAGFGRCLLGCDPAAVFNSCGSIGPTAFCHPELSVCADH